MKFHMSARSYCHTELWHIYIHLLPMSAWLVHVHIPCTSVYGIPCIPFHQAGKSWNKVTFAWPLFVETVIKFSIVWPSFTYETHQIHQTRPEGPTVQSQWSTSQSPSDESVASNLRVSQNFFVVVVVVVWCCVFGPIWSNFGFCKRSSYQLQMLLLEAMNSHFSVPETGRHHSVHQEACEVTINVSLWLPSHTWTECRSAYQRQRSTVASWILHRAQVKVHVRLAKAAK